MWDWKEKTGLSEILNIRYIKLQFILQFTEDCVMPKHKVSAIRGGMGEMILRANCIRNRNCDECDFEEECIARRTIYTKEKHKPDFVTNGDSIGYLIECEDYGEYYKAGDKLSINLVLFGKTIVYFNQYLQALFSLGLAGVGNGHARYQIVAVKNIRNKNILDGNNILMSNYQIETISDYVDYRLKRLNIDDYGRYEMVFFTPASIKYQGEFIGSFSMDAVWKAIIRRIYMLGNYEEIDTTLLRSPNLIPPSMIEEKSKISSVRRYSNRKKQSMTLYGIKGIMRIMDCPRDLLPIILAGEITHIGKNISFGFGRYRLKNIIDG